MAGEEPAMENHIAEWRARKGLSQRQLAGLLFVHPSQVAAWESGTKTPRIEIILEMARLLECRVEDLFVL